MAGHALLPDGRYDVFVVDADEADDGTVTALELTVLAGAHKGAVIRLGAPMGRAIHDVIGTPGTLVVTDGTPKLTLEG